MEKQGEASTASKVSETKPSRSAEAMKKFEQIDSESWSWDEDAPKPGRYLWDVCEDKETL